MYSDTGHPVLRDGVSPFGHLRIKGCLPPPRSVSPATASFIGSSLPSHPPYALTCYGHPISDLTIGNGGRSDATFLLLQLCVVCLARRTCRLFYAFFCCRRTIPAVCRFRDGRGQGLARGTVSAHLTVFTKRAWPPAKLTSPLEVSGLAVGRDQARSETFAHETFPVLPVSHLNFVGEMVKLVPIHYRRV